MNLEGWTKEQVEQLAPDAKSIKSGRGLVSVAKWPLLGGDDEALWGHCQGSGKKPYQVQIDLSEPAFKCSCPSRKFPCKHGLALFFLAIEHTEAFNTAAPSSGAAGSGTSSGLSPEGSTSLRPDWVTDWLDKRRARKEKKELKKEASPPDPVKQKKRKALREKKVQGALAALQIWLQDLLREGLATAKQRPHSYWDDMAKRLVDGQVSGLARLVRNIPSIIGRKGLDESFDELMAQLGKINMALAAYENLDQLSEGLQADVRSIIGWNTREEELAALPSVNDEWAIVGQIQEDEENLRMQRTWLLGRKSSQYALILQFAYGRQAFKLTLPLGFYMTACLVYYPSALPRRAMLRKREPSIEAVTSLAGYSSFDELFETYSSTLAKNPWMSSIPAAIGPVLPIVHKGKRLLLDEEEKVLPLTPAFQQWWPIMSLAGGRPISLFGEWSGQSFLPLSVVAQGRFAPLLGSRFS